MAKNICIFSDGTGQKGGVHADQRLSNVYKLYRAMRPGPDSPISPQDQVAFYDAGLGTSESRGVFRRIRPLLERAVGTGIDHNIIDCYEQIIAYYEPGDRVLLFGFSRGAYTVRALANVMNLCGVPTRMPDGSPVPRHGRPLRKIATDAVKFVYSHGAGKARDQEPYFSNREELGRRFRAKYGSSPVDAENAQGNVQPTFIGVFDTVAALRTTLVRSIVWGAATALWILTVLGIFLGWALWIVVPIGLLAGLLTYRLIKLLVEAFKYFSPDPRHRLSLKRLSDWPEILKTGHFAGWNRRHYDRWLDPDVGHGRHAIAIDEDRENFPRVEWGAQAAYERTRDRHPAWLEQVWFAGCHSDVGGSYPEPESRLSDIALDWMVSELRECVPSICINEALLNRHPDAEGLQHREDIMFRLWERDFKWPRKPRKIDPKADLHPTVLERLAAGPVPQSDEVKDYRPENLGDHEQAQGFYKDERPSRAH
ncbi:T6SS phospholipase effector Tle1-like catalytic domain-containing protein [Citreimonas salinaria]|uniref:Uncharacterized protein, PA2063/DUF2235 family n=1 Tax=Citreimonas salinaria TaxID=321339 RepID=A0A1H3ISS6_9RHOB|nr:DUF2235 domain-containing protein [Citreimonas salinaria]SDY29924.1 Uncharacterized protein, PA2063/DUF2235 family [Citreimonas salinaria]